MVELGALASEQEGLRQALASLSARRLRIRWWERTDEFLLNAHDIKLAALIDLDFAEGRLGMIAAATRRLTSGKIFALASDDQLVEASGAYVHGLDAVFAKKAGHQVIATQIFNLALREINMPRTTTTEIGAFRFDELSRAVSVEGDIRLRLTEKESLLLSTLLRNGTEPLSRERLSLEVFAIPYQSNDRRVDVHISNLRRKLRSIGVPFGIFPSRGGGYYGTVLEDEFKPMAVLAQ